MTKLNSKQAERKPRGAKDTKAISGSITSCAPTASAKSADNKGRVTLGEKFANRTVIVKELSDTEVLIELATVIPDRELWLHKNQDAIASVVRGLQEAREGKFASNPPDLGRDAKLAKTLADE